MQNDNLYKKLRFFALCLAIICMLLSLIKRAKAEEMNSDLYNDVKEIFDEYFQGYNTEQLNTVTSECPYVCIYNVHVDNNNCIIADFFNTKEIGINSTFINNYYYTSGYSGYNFSQQAYIVVNGTNNNFTANIGNCYRFMARYLNNTWRFQNLQKYPITNSDPVLDGVWYSNRYFVPQGKNTLYSEDSYSSSSYSVSLEPILSYGNYFQNYGNNAFRIIEDTYVPITNNTAGFECYKLETKGGIYFYADFSRLISISNAVGNSSTFSCDIHLDDTVQTITLDSTSEYYQYDIAYSETYYSFPITAFVPNYTEYDDVWIDNVKVINTTSSPGGSATNTFAYITPIVIQGDSYNNGDLVNPNDVIIPNGEYDPPTNIEITENTYLVEFSNKDGLSFSEFHNTDIPNIYEDNTTWVYMDKQTYTFRDFIEDFLGLNFPPKLIEYITGINTKEDAVEQMTNYLYDNAFTLTSDMVIFVYIDGDWKSGDFTSDDLTYWVYYTASGRLRAISQLMNSTNTNISRQLALSSSYYQYAKTKLNTIDKNLYEFANTQLGFNNSFLSKLNNIDTLLSRIESVLNRILDSLKNLHLNQLDTIDTKLSTIIANMGNSSGGINEDDTVAEAIQYYKSHNENGVPTAQVYIDDKMSIWISGKVHLWLQGTDANTDKTNMINSVFDTLTSIYDSMKNNNDIFPNIQYYLDAIAKNNEYGYDTHGDYMTRLFKGNVDISTYDGISE